MDQTASGASASAPGARTLALTPKQCSRSYHRSRSHRSPVLPIRYRDLCPAKKADSIGTEYCPYCSADVESRVAAADEIKQFLGPRRSRDPMTTPVPSSVSPRRLQHDVKVFLATPIQTEDKWLALVDITNGAVFYVENQSELNMTPHPSHHVYKVWIWEFREFDSYDSDLPVCDGICTRSDYKLCFCKEERAEFFRLMGIITYEDDKEVFNVGGSLTDADSKGVWVYKRGLRGTWSINKAAC